MGIEVEGMDTVEAWKGNVILPPGKHAVIIETADETQSNAGHPQVEILFVSLKGEGEIRDWLTFSRDSQKAWEGSLGRAKMLLDAVGIRSQEGKWTFPVNDLPGKKLMVAVAKEPKFNDPTKEVSKVKAFMALDESDIPADTNGLGASTTNDEDLPF